MNTSIKPSIELGLMRVAEISNSLVGSKSDPPLLANGLAMAVARVEQRRRATVFEGLFGRFVNRNFRASIDFGSYPA